MPQSTNLIRLQVVQEELMRLERQMQLIRQKVNEALENDDQELASTLYPQFFRLGVQYLQNEREFINLNMICKLN